MLAYIRWHSFLFVSGIGNSQFQVLTSEGPDRDITFIFDFVQKTPNLKVSKYCNFCESWSNLNRFQELLVFVFSSCSSLHLHLETRCFQQWSLESRWKRFTELNQANRVGQIGWARRVFAESPQRENLIQYTITNLRQILF